MVIQSSQVLTQVTLLSSKRTQPKKLTSVGFFIDFVFVICYTGKVNTRKNLYKDTNMFDSIEIRKVANGFIVILNTEDDASEYVFDTSRKAIRFIKEYVEAKVAVTA